MNVNRYNKYWIISGTTVFIILFAFLIVELYTSTLEDAKKDYQQQQLEMVKTASLGINFLIGHLLNDIKFLSSHPQLQKIDPRSLVFLDEYFKNYETDILQEIFVLDNDNRMVYNTGSIFPLSRDNLDSIKRIKNEPYITNVISSKINIADSALVCQIFYPIITREPGERIGYLGFTINFNELINTYIKPLKLSKDDFTWVIDGEGRLIYHPNHQEMLFNSVKNTTGECFSCHTSFKMQNSILSSTLPSTGEYSVLNDEPSKVMAYFPIIIQNQKWILVISTFVSKVTEDLRERFKLFFIIGFIILGVILFFSGLIYYFNARRIRAEEAQRSLEQLNEYQEQLGQASKLASIGELVDSVAHEINTPAGIIAAHVDGMLLEKKVHESVSSSLNVIKKQTERISNYTKSLLNYSQRMVFHPEPIDIKNLIDECIFLVGHRFRFKRISVIKEYEEIPNIKADPHQLEQVLINIMNNAVDAIETSGEIKISVKLTEKERISKSVLISIKDNGEGITEENINKIFNPFFSTKLSTNGTGLGLSIAKAIIQRHKGHIEVKSEYGKGTEFLIYLPVNT